jgi:putative ABC transport system permease protein
VGGALETIGDAVRRTAHALDAQLPAVRPVSFEKDRQLVLLPAKVGAMLLGVFGGLALLLATVGIYGVASFAVARRTGEIGIRSPLGAGRIDVLRLVVGESMRRVGIGFALGCCWRVRPRPCARLSTLWRGVVDPITVTETPLVLGAVAFAASWAPAMRAAKVSPVVAMRNE